jgi:hypothetical protein
MTRATSNAAGRLAPRTFFLRALLLLARPLDGPALQGRFFVQESPTTSFATLAALETELGGDGELREIDGYGA